MRLDQAGAILRQRGVEFTDIQPGAGTLPGEEPRMLIVYLKSGYGRLANAAMRMEPGVRGVRFAKDSGDQVMFIDLVDRPVTAEPEIIYPSPSCPDVGAGGLERRWRLGRD